MSHTTRPCAHYHQRVHAPSAGLEVIPDLEVPCPSDDAAVPDTLPPSPPPPGLTSQRSPEGQYSHPASPISLSSGHTHFKHSSTTSERLCLMLFALSSSPLRHGTKSLPQAMVWPGMSKHVKIVIEALAHVMPKPVIASFTIGTDLVTKWCCAYSVKLFWPVQLHSL